MKRIAYTTGLLLMYCMGCSDEGNETNQLIDGDVSQANLLVQLQPELTITEGLAPGDELENIVDGWQVTFSKYLVAVGHVEIARSSDEQAVHDDRVSVYDLRKLPNNGVLFSAFKLESGRWDRFGYATAHTESSAEGAEGVSAEDLATMSSNEATYLIEGQLSNPAGRSCPPGAACRDVTTINFRFAVPAETVYGPCEPEDGLPGVAITEGVTTAAITIHGDHLFFDACPTGEEIIQRRAQWLANGDTNADGTVTEEELKAIAAGAIFPADLYSLGGCPLAVQTAWDFARSQLHTQGHFQGEGECPWTIDGVSSSHDHGEEDHDD